MASTITLLQTLNWCAPYIRFAPLTLGAGNEPAVTNANLIAQTMVGPPFAWAWNRRIVTTTCVQGQQDYPISIPDWGYIENATVALSGQRTFELKDQIVLGEATEQGRPMSISVHLDDDMGNITFRLLSVPDAAYTLKITYQRGLPLFAATTSPPVAVLNQPWGIPDAWSHIFQNGFLALALMYLDDPRWQTFNQKFVSHLLSAQEGLDEEAKNIFLGNWFAITGEPQSNVIRTTQGHQARGSL